MDFKSLILLLAALPIGVWSQTTVTVPREPVGSAPALPLGSPHPPPAYMKDNVNNFFGTAPDKGSLTGPVLGSLSKKELNQIHHNTTVTSRQSSGDGYWLSSLGSLGQMPLAPSGYQFYRNVKDFGAVGDGVTDDTAAINRAAAAFSSSDTSTLRCGNSTCGSTTTEGAVVYFPAGTYLISTPIIQYYYTQFVGNAYDLPTIKGTFNFTGIALFDSDFYVPGGNGSEWYINQSNFYRQIRNFNFDLTGMNWTNTDNDQTYVPAGVHWQVGQATSITNCNFNMATSVAGQSATAVGIYMENGSGGMVSDLTFTGGNIGFLAGSQQFTAKNLQFTSCLTAIYQQWNWGFTWKNIYVLSCYVALDCTSYSGVTDQGTGSITVLDSHFNGVPYAITIASLGSEQPNIVLDNLLVENSESVVLISGGDTILEGSTDALYFNSWANGYQYWPDGSGGKRTGFIDPAPVKPSSLLDSSGAYFTQSKPQYPAQNPLVATDYGISNDGTGDQMSAINSFLAGNVGTTLFFPGGIYQVQGTVKIPVGSIITGSGWSQIMGTGSYFEDASDPQVMVQVGEVGDSGIIQISDFLFTVKGATAGAILMEWNVHESTQGSAAMWDAHFRVGGATGTDLQLADCPAGASSVNTKCMAASMLLHVTSEASGYFENVWAWTADHDLDSPLNAQATESDEGIPLNVLTDISIYSGRGILIESQGPTWFYGSSSEHNQLYQYQLSNASNIYLGHMQTETPYYQPNPNSLSPYTPGQFPSDPTFENCADDGCKGAWALRIVNSSEVFIYSAGFYSFFQNNELGCAPEENCQLALIDTNYASYLWMYNIFTKGNVQIVSPQGGIPDLLFNSTTSDGYTSEIAAWLALAKDGSDIGDNGEGGSGIVTVDPQIWSEPAASQTVQCEPPCTYVWPPVTLSTPTTYSFPLLTTTLTVGYYPPITETVSGSPVTTSVFEISIITTIITIPPVTTTVVSWFDATITVNSTTVYLIPSVVPPAFNITDPTIIGGSTYPPRTRTFWPPPWPGSTVPPSLSTPTSTPTSGTGGTTPVGTKTTKNVDGGTSVHHTRGPPSPTCTHVTGCGHACGTGPLGFLDICGGPCWLFCSGPPGIDPEDPDQPGGVTEPGEDEPDNSSECETKTFTSCNTICTPSCTTSCVNVIGCEETSGTSECSLPTATNIWSSTAGDTDYPELGDGGIFGYTYLPPEATPILFTSMAITPAPTTSSSGANPTSFISCTHFDEDPDQGVTSAYCVCSSTTLSEIVDTSVTPANSCAYTTLPGSSVSAPIQTITTTETGICSVCTFVGQAETCTSIQGCTPTPTSTPPVTSTSYPWPTNTAENVGGAYCFTADNGDFVEFTKTDAQNVVQAFCASNYELQPGNTFGFSEGDIDNADYTVFATASWAADQSGCGTEGDFPFNANSDECLDGWSTDFYCEDEDGGDSGPTTSYGGGYVLQPPGDIGCILIELFAMPANNAQSKRLARNLFSPTRTNFPYNTTFAGHANLTALRQGVHKTPLWSSSNTTSSSNRPSLFNSTLLATLLNGTDNST